MLNYGPEDQFSFSSSVTSVHNLCDALGFDEFENGRELLFATTAFWLVLKIRRDKRQAVHCSPPIFEGFIVIVHVFQFQQMPDGPGDDDVITDPMRFLF